MDRLARTTFALLLAALASCSPKPASTSAPAAASAWPVAHDPAMVGSYPLKSKSGGGYFYDEVLEYRVWYPMPGGGDGFHAFATCEEAQAFAKATPHAETPLVLVRQREWIDEPKPGEFVRKSGERVTEWQVEWLHDALRASDSIERFLAGHAPR